MALSTGRTTARTDNQVIPNLVSVGLKASAKIYIGSLVCIEASSGYAVPGASATGLIPVGIADRNQPDAVLGGVPGSFVEDVSAVNGTTKVDVLRGCFKLNNSSGDPVVAGDLFSACYIEDDQTVCHTGTSKSGAGYVVKIDSASASDSSGIPGVWVAIGLEAPADASGEVATTRSISTTAPLAGGGDLSANRTLSITAATTIAAGSMSAADKLFEDRLHSAGNTTSLTDGDVSVAIGTATWFKLPAATLSANHTVTLATTGAIAGDQITITRLDATAHTYSVIDGGSGTPTLFVMPNSKVNFAKCQFDGTNWFLKECGVQ